MRQKYKNIKEYKDPWYAFSANRLVMTLGALQGEVNCDVCVIGAGFTGLTAALELAQKGLSVVLLEMNSIAAGATGRNGGHILRGYNKGPGFMIEKFGLDDARLMNNMTLEGLALILDRIQQHDIKCDLKFGHLTAAIRPQHIRELEQEIRGWEKIGHKDLKLINKKETNDLVKTQKYIGGLYDAKGAHFHPLNYALGLAEAAQRMGVKIYDGTRVMDIIDGAKPRIVTGAGAVNASFALVAGAADIPGFDDIEKYSMNVSAHMLSTESIGPVRAGNILSKDIAVMDSNFLMNYYRLTPDHRMLFGGTINYSNRDYKTDDDALRRRMIELFPQLRTTLIEHCWSGVLNMTVNRMPRFGRKSSNIFYVHGFGGHGIIAASMAGRLMAETVTGTAQRFDVFGRIRHTPFPGGDLLKRPLFMLGVAWYQLRDMLS